MPDLATAHYAYNLGAPYEYGVHVDTYTLPDSYESSDPVGSLGRAVLDHLAIVFRRALDIETNFNEALVIGYSKVQSLLLLSGRALIGSPTDRSG